MSTPTKAMIRSFVITFLVTLLPLLLADGVDWSFKGLIALCLAAARTAVSYVWPGGLYGLNAVDEGP